MTEQPFSIEKVTVSSESKYKLDGEWKVEPVRIVGGIIKLNHLHLQPKLIQQLYLLYIQLRGGYWNCKSSFAIWRFIMTHDIERLNKNFCGLNAFDEFYSCLNGYWDGDR